MDRAPCRTCKIRHSLPDRTLCRTCRNREAQQFRTKHRDLPEAQRVKAIARATLRVYVSRGKVAKPDECSRCRRRVPLHGHHHDYGKPLDVVWLCRSCHRLLHESMKN